MQSQGLLFSEPSISDTGVWCQLPPEIDPSKWARICREIGNLPPDQFEQVYKFFTRPQPARQSSIVSRLKPVFRRKISSKRAIPVVSIGPGSIGSEYQLEFKEA